MVITNGVSYFPTLNAASARRLHADDVTVLAVGVGARIDLSELRAIASEPVCVNVIANARFMYEQEALRALIERKTCDGQPVLLIYKIMPASYVSFIKQLLHLQAPYAYLAMSSLDLD